MDDRRVTGFLVNAGGELQREMKLGDRVVSGNSIKAFHNKRMRELAALKAGDKQEWKLEKFFKGHVPELRELTKNLSAYEKAFLFSVTTYIGYEDCCLKYDNGKCMDFEDLVLVSGMSRGKVSEVLNSLREQDIIYKGINSVGFQYFMNPWLYCKGVRINAVLKTMFKNYHIRVMGGVRWGDIKIKE